MYLSICGTYCGNLSHFLRTKHFLECVLSLDRGLSHSHHNTVLSGVASTCLAKCTLQQKIGMMRKDVKQANKTFYMELVFLMT